jgi:hypothetical protein
MTARLTDHVRSHQLNYKDWLLRVVILGLIGGSLALSWSSVNQRLAPLQKRSRELSSAVARASAEVDQLERKWSKAQSEQIQRRLQRAEEDLFRDQTALHSWVVSLRREATPLGFQPKAEFDKPVPQPSDKSPEKLAVIPATISLDMRGSTAGDEKISAYQRLLRFTERLSLNSKRADLMEMRIEAGAGSLSSAVLLFGLWAVEGGPR